MILEREQVSDKNELVTAVLAIFWGFFGLHRFYVGKWISGTVYFIIGSTSFIPNLLKIFGINIIYNALITTCATLLVCVAVLYDLFALKTESFCDGHNKLIISKATREESGLFLSEKEKAIASTNAWIAVVLFFLFIIVRFVLIPEIVSILA